jgi:lipopolysaccharide transport system permease protein
VGNQGMLGKVYFPRLIFPVIPILTKFVDFSISLIIIIAVIIYYQVGLTWNIIFIPFFLMLMMIFPLGVGLWLSALAIRYRDVKFAMGFVMRMLMYTAPIVYTASSIPEGYRMLYSLNPIVGIIEGFRACFLGTPILWEYILPGMVVSVVILLTGALYFRRMERVFVDVI